MFQFIPIYELSFCGTKIRIFFMDIMGIFLITKHNKSIINVLVQLYAYDSFIWWTSG